MDFRDDFTCYYSGRLKPCATRILSYMMCKLQPARLWATAASTADGNLSCSHVRRLLKAILPLIAALGEYCLFFVEDTWPECSSA